MKKIRYGVIGIQGIGKYHIKRALEHPNVELSALVDINGDYSGKNCGKVVGSHFNCHLPY